MDVKVITSDILRLNVSSSVASLGACNERKFSKSLTVEDLKVYTVTGFLFGENCHNTFFNVFQYKLELITGISSMSMDLEVYSEDNKLVCKLNDASALLGSYLIDDDMRLHVCLYSMSIITGRSFVCILTRCKLAAY